MQQFSAADKICKISNPFDWTPEGNALMVEACREMASFHYKQNPDIQKLYNKYSFDPASLRSTTDLERIPSLGVHAMKYFLFSSLPDSAAVLKLTSSGTRGQKTQIWFDQQSLDRAQSMLDGLWRQQGLVTESPVNYLMFIYDPKDASDLGIAFSIANQMRFAPARDTFFAIRKNKEGQWFLDMAGVMAKLEEYAKTQCELRIHGIPSFIFEAMTALKTIGKSFEFPKSHVLTGGGWKAAEDKKVTKEYFYEMLQETLGIKDENVLDGYGMAEHSAPYMECRLHRFHIPVYCRIIIRDPATMRSLSLGEQGLIELLTPFNSMMPNLSVLSTDIGQLDKDKCRCGYQSPTFTLLGRGGLKKHKGCALTASEVVKRRA
ncbi:MAG: hypothetical protein AB7T49_19050 [Oligoflexales bacterium]